MTDFHITNSRGGTDLPSAADTTDDVVVHRDVEQLPGRDELARADLVFGAGGWVSFATTGLL